MSDQPYQVMPPLDADQRHALLQSIKANGVLEPVVLDEDNNILDGHHRVEIAEELGIEYPRRVLPGLDEAGKLRYAITTNAIRRQLAPAQVSSMIAHLRTKGMSIRQIAAVTSVPRETVRRQVSGDPDGSPDEITGSDGKTYASTRPTQTPGPSDAAIEPPVGPVTTSRPDEEEALSPASADAPDPRVAGESPGSFAAPGAGADHPARPYEPSRRVAEFEAQMAADGERRVAIRNLTSVLTYIVPLAITPGELAERSYAPVLDEFKQADLDLAAETMAAIAELKRGM